MEGKIRILDTMLVIFMVIGTPVTCYVTFVMSILATDGGGGFAALGGGLFGFIFTSSFFVFIPFWARQSLQRKNATPCIIHSVITFLMLPPLLPISIWELILAVKVKAHFKELTNEENS